MKNFFSFWVIPILALLFYIVGFFLLNYDIFNPLVDKYTELSSELKSKLWGSFIFQISSLVLTVSILKYLLGMNHFKNAIKNVFIEIFSEHSFLKNLDKPLLLKIANNIEISNNDITFIDKTSDNESVSKLKKYFDTDKNLNKNKNYIVEESIYSTTLMANGIEIMHRKLKCKIINEGKFEFQYTFNAPNDEELNYNKYLKNTNSDRFNETSYKSMLKSSNSEDGLTINESFSMKKEKDIDFIQIIFSKEFTIINEIIEIEFSISHKFDLIDSEKIKDYYHSSYTYPHAVRHIKFQLEKYNNCFDKIPSISPILYSNDDNNKKKIIKGNYTESLYYKTYLWEIYYSQNSCTTVSINV